MCDRPPEGLLHDHGDDWGFRDLNGKKIAVQRVIMPAVIIADTWEELREKLEGRA